MFCTKCGKQVEDNEKFCQNCGTPTGDNNQFCKKCGKQVEDNEKFCQNCGTPTGDNNQFCKESTKEVLPPKGLLGFRTNKGWKMTLSIIYLVFVGLFAAGSLSGGREGLITGYDFAIEKLYSVVLILLLLSPYIFLSNTKFRDKLPLFKNHNAGLSTVGMTIIFVALLILSGVVNEFHSEEYLADMDNHAYKETSSEAATCEKDGTVEKLCEYCGTTTFETIKATGHTWDSGKVTTEATCTEAGTRTYTCTTCNKTKTEEIKSTGHAMKQVSSDAEKIVSKCDKCGKEDVKVLAQPSKKTTTTTAKTTTTKAPTTTTKTPTTTTQKPVEHTHTYVDTEYTPNFSTKKATVKTKCSSCGDEQTKKVSMSTDEISKYLKENCKKYTYEEVARYPDKYKKELAVFTGEVLQVQEFLGTTTLLVNVTKEGNSYYSYYKDTVYVSYKFSSEFKILDGDVITMYGEMQGEESYLSVLGQYITIPKINVYYAELNK